MGVFGVGFVVGFRFRGIGRVLFWVFWVGVVRVFLGWVIWIVERLNIFFWKVENGGNNNKILFVLFLIKF